jgi:transcriptional regulator with XRE-family HTH domain
MTIQYPTLTPTDDKSDTRKDMNMWLDKLKELKKEKGMSVKQIAERTNLPERTVNRVFSGDTDNPYVDTLHRIVSALGGSLDDILTDSKVVVGGTDLKTLQEDNDTLQATIEKLTAENALLSAENKILNDQVTNLTAEKEILRLKLDHKEEIIALHNYYNKLKPTE